MPRVTDRDSDNELELLRIAVQERRTLPAGTQLFIQSGDGHWRRLYVGEPDSSVSDVIYLGSTKRAAHETLNAMWRGIMILLPLEARA